MNSETMRNLGSALLTDKPISESVRSDILESWARSHNAKVNPQATILPAYMPTEAASKLNDEGWQFRKEQTRIFVDRFYDLLIKLEAAIFYTTSDLTIIIQRGNEAFLKKLNSFNLGIGTNLQEKYVGTNAAALAYLSHQESYVLGSEHYINVLKDYATCAVEAINFDDKTVYGYFVFISSRDRYTEYHPLILDLITQVTKYYLNHMWDNSEHIMMNDLLYQNAEDSNRGLIFVDQNGFIIRTNPWLDSHIRSGFRSQKFLDIFPELAETMDCLQTGQNLPLKEVYIRDSSGKKVNIFMECRPSKKNGQVIGMIVSLIDKKVLYKHTAQLSNYNAYFTFADLIGSNQRFDSIKTTAIKAAKNPCSILITGESGTGKELFAQAIHNGGNHKNGPFISINCAAIPKELIGSELFGYIEGAFTGARKGGSPGKFELAHKGTIFLDEIGEMPYDMQSVLLRVLEERRVTRLGGNHPTPIDVKIISATNKDLWERVASKKFRLDLFYRLNTIKIEIPPLRERLDDIDMLVNYFLKQFNLSLNKHVTSVSPEVYKIFEEYYWPGNVRELRNVIERGVALCSSDTIDVDDLPLEMQGSYLSYIPDDEITIHGQTRQTIYYDKVRSSERLLEKYNQQINEKKRILELLEKYNGNKTRVAKELGITRTTLYKKLQY
ncbi:sigma-54 interaction domain-containing protein [Desulfitobacterium chlororespirans]|uniref:Transcriptional regulator containing PAS, AAA-type ATPase, and DNA-binding Fis domains n=1 Tax=Desulfitobacterium chlororespirans DSM 11544 TaxID=1121395 RepID=A0A1M7UZA8_9FIRM|nr:sigma 54-interacting transcriptional regulator [Desulfitobacterium chlororespirans]SHN88272.1 Transcriptional regulator containing PAS, AAA-type ATPase, and DNA-binding Fis domains [Desulfitobacterium chlororespirans DSM 11544]